MLSFLLIRGIMPKKTRKEKIIADLRRKMVIQEKTNIDENTVISAPIINNPIEKKTYSLNVGNTHFRPAIDNTSRLMVVDPKYIKADLKKTLFLTAVVLVVEFMLYWALERNGIEIINKLIGK